MSKSRGQIAYEADVERKPTYHDGTPRRKWEELTISAQWSWEPKWERSNEVDQKMTEQQTPDLTPRPEVQWFAKQMELKLRANDHKPHWSGMHTDYLIHRLFQEAHELWRALQNGEPPENVVKEAADVANFAMMIADVVGQVQSIGVYLVQGEENTVRRIDWDRVIPFVEKALGFKLHNWQKSYLQTGEYAVYGRVTGRTTVYCVKLALTYGEPIRISDLGKLRDEEHGPQYNDWFKSFFLEIWTKLKEVGLPVVTIIRVNKSTVYGNDCPKGACEG